MSVKSVSIDGQKYPLAPLEPPKHDFPHTGIYAFTRREANSWLRYNYKNRSQRKSGSDGYAQDIINGDYDLNGDTIKVSRPLQPGEDPDIPEGHVLLIDGQHRLQAVVKSNTVFVTCIVSGLAPEVRRTVDSGIKRQFYDVLKMNGEIHASVLSSVIRRARAWELGDRKLYLKEGMTKPQGDKYLAQHPELRRSVEIASRVGSENPNVRKSVVALAHWLFMQADETKAPEFFARVGDRAEMPKEHPIMLLCRRLESDRSSAKREDRVPDWKQMCYYIRTWNAYLLGRSDFTLFSSGDEKKIPDILNRQDAAAKMEEIETKKARQEARQLKQVA